MTTKTKMTMDQRVSALESEMGMKKTGVTRIFFLLDRSGSMANIKSDTIGGFNNYLDTITENIKGEARFTMAQFDNQGFDVLSENLPLRSAIRLNNQNYEPRGGTPLIDSAMRIMQMAKSEANPGDNVIIVFQTDGHENQSTEYKNNDLKAEVEIAQGKDWAINFIGAGINAYDQAGQWGIAQAATMSYGKDMAGTKSAFASVARASTAYSVSGQSIDASFTDKEKKESGDDETKRKAVSKS